MKLFSCWDVTVIKLFVAVNTSNEERVKTRLDAFVASSAETGLLKQIRKRLILPLECSQVANDPIPGSENGDMQNTNTESDQSEEIPRFIDICVPAPKDEFLDPGTQRIYLDPPTSLTVGPRPIAIYDTSSSGRLMPNIWLAAAMTLIALFVAHSASAHMHLA